MGTEEEHTDLEENLRSGRYGYGGVLTDGKVRRIEWVEEESFESEEAIESVRYTAFNSIGAELVPLFAEGEQAEAVHTLLACTNDRLSGPGLARLGHGKTIPRTARESISDPVSAS